MVEQPEIEVELIDFTGMGGETLAPIHKLVYTKSTRLEQGQDTRQKIGEMSHDELMTELEYMANTIPSSWEFISYTFEIKNVTRAFTHQFVRTRTGSYAQQTMRLLNKKGFTYRIPPRVKDHKIALEKYKECMAKIQSAYDSMIENDGVPAEDARGVLPTNIHTNIIAQFNLRTLAEMARSRTGIRTQDEYREVLDLMIARVLDAHPWAKLFLIPENMKHIKGIEKFVSELHANDIISNYEYYAQLKHLDKIRKGEY